MKIAEQCISMIRSLVGKMIIPWLGLHYRDLHCNAMSGSMQLQLNAAQWRYFTDVQCSVASFRSRNALHSIPLYCGALHTAAPEMGRWYRWEDGWEQSWRENKKTKQICRGNDRRIFSDPTFADFLKFNITL